jgi:hypothetical protein
MERGRPARKKTYEAGETPALPREGAVSCGEAALFPVSRFDDFDRRL